TVSMAMATKLILDTDIGDDVDDALCLGLILGCPEVELRGVTTVFGNVAARARQARTILKVAGEAFARVPVSAGCGGSMASRPLHNVRAYLEDHLPNQDASCLPEAELPEGDPRHGVDLLLDELKGDVVPVTIGAMTNLAMAIVKDWRVIRRIPRILSMAGEFRAPMAEWNIRCDPEAAHIVLGSGVPMDIIPWTIGMQVSFRQEHLDRLSRSRRPLAQRLAMAIQCWQMNWSDNGKKARPMPHLFDPMTIATLIWPELCTWKRGWVKVELTGTETYGYTTFREDENGPHRVAWDAKVEESLGFWFERIEQV
ncbi:MAG TPA: nucleoside hydrolase, partial [Chloroflexota bacterium]|nr:nucleoside hydrolase [Chloroflexota bacterium]